MDRESQSFHEVFRKSPFLAATSRFLPGSIQFTSWRNVTRRECIVIETTH